MRLLIAGSRNIKPTFKEIEEAVHEMDIVPIIVICGMCRGPDKAGAAWAKASGVCVWRLPAPWTIGRHAGAYRNNEMAKLADYALIFWDGESHGTQQMIGAAEREGVIIHLIRKDRYAQLQ